MEDTTVQAASSTTAADTCGDNSGILFDSEKDTVP